MIFDHGTMAHSPDPLYAYYYIDMELCQLDLASYIADDFPFPCAVSGLNCDSASTEEDLLLDGRLSCIQKILCDIVAGLLYIHEQGQVHRDLKPRNSSSSLPHVNPSSLSFGVKDVENR
jgi:serine/threonine protein kinase